MRRVVLVVYPGFELLDLSGPASVFNGANRAMSQHGAAPAYGIELRSAAGGQIASSSGVAVATRAIDARAAGRIDTLLIVGAERAPLQAAMADPLLLKAMPGLARGARRFGSVCTGVFVLARLGLIEGRRVTTHWDASAPLARACGGTVDADALYVTDGRLWTSAGVSTGIDMALAMVAQDLGAAVAGEIAKRLVLYARRPGYQSQFSSLLKAQARAGSPFGELMDWIQTHLDAPLDVPALAERAAMTQRTFHRKFTAAVGQTPARFVDTVRLDAARMLLSQGQSLKAVARQVGLFPATRLADAFERRFGVTPRLFRELHGEF